MKSIEKSKDEPLVASIILTTYNGGAYLREQLDSLLCQTYQNIEIIISDDKSNKETLSIINDYAASDNRIKVYTNEGKRGCHPNNVFGASKCTGDIIFFCDQDDTWDKTKIEKHIDVYTKDPSVKWVFNRLVVTDSTNKIKTGLLTDTIPNYYRSKGLLEMTWGACVGAAMTSYRADLIHASFPMGDKAPGHDSWIQLMIWPAQSYFIDEILQTYRQHNSNDTGWKTNLDNEEIENREAAAIRDNGLYLQALTKNKNVSIYKRLFFLLVIIAKQLRLRIREITGKRNLFSRLR